jgi:hypothetical protein
MYLLHFYISLFPGTEAGLIILVIGAVAFLFWNWLFKRNIKKQSTRRIATWSATLISTALVYTVVIALLFRSLTSAPPQKKFDQTAWLTDKAQRYQMANDIINSQMLIGKDSNAVNEILGFPDSKIRSHGQCSYEMGSSPAGLGITFHSLLLKRDSAGKVLSAVHIQVND